MWHSARGPGLDGKTFFLFFGLHLFLAKNAGKILKVLVALRNVTPVLGEKYLQTGILTETKERN